MAEIRTTIEVINATQNNLKNLTIKIPRDRLTVITGVSGSGKSSLAFDVIYGEAQRRFLDSISNYAKSRIGQVKKPNVEAVKGLSPVIAIEQKKANNNPRSTVGTVTDLNDYLRLLFSTIGVGHCPICHEPLKPFNASQLAESIANLPQGTIVELRAPLFKIFGEDYAYLFDSVRDKGFKNLLLDGQPFDLSNRTEIDEDHDYQMEIVIDRFVVRPDVYIQLAKSIESAMFALSEEFLLKIVIMNEEDVSEETVGRFYESISCVKHHFTLCEMQPFHFSFNNPSSACGTCLGVGKSYVVEPSFLVVNPEKSILGGALHTNVFNSSTKDSWHAVIMYSLAEHYNFSLNTPFNQLSQRAHDIIFFGTSGEKILMVQPPFSKKSNWIVGREISTRGFVRIFESWYRNYIRKSLTDERGEPGFIKECMIEKVCPECLGARLKRQRLLVEIEGKNINDLSTMPLKHLKTFLTELDYQAIPINKRAVAQSIVNEIITRVQLLIDIGLHYLSLGRRSDSISGGEMQRIKMSTQVSSELMGMLYVMDEPSIGLHPRDSDKVITLMKKLRDQGNTVIVVEHDIETMKQADFLVEIGPGPGIHGGNVIAAGPSEEVINQPNSLTGDFITGRKVIPVPKKRRIGRDAISLVDASENNLKHISIDIPLHQFVCVTGVSGSGKSTLINETLFKNLEILKKRARIVGGKLEHLFGPDLVNNVINIDQSAIGRSSKSNPATYIGIYDKIRDLFANTIDAKNKGYTSLDFSLTHHNGTRCEHCAGDGIITTNLQFMADIETICPVCKGSRFSSEGLEVKYNEKNISEVLEMTMEEAHQFFKDNKYLAHKLAIIENLGLGYIKLGQSSTTLSGGEAQRVKLATELAKIKKGSHNLYILDEPTTGLHPLDIMKLLECLNHLVDAGHSVLVIEHNLDVIKCADFIIDLGPEGGDEGGFIVATGTPEEVSKVDVSYTGQFLKTVL